MQNSQEWERIVFYLVSGGAVFCFIFLAGAEKSTLQPENGFAQIMAAEASVLKQWQESGGLSQNLAPGAKGKAVELLQKILSQDKAIYPEQIISGFYGGRTEDAVKNFQEEYGLPETGSVDESTRKKINEIFGKLLCPEETALYPDFLLKAVTRSTSIPRDYTPPGLVDISEIVRTKGKTCLRASVVPFITKMFADARKDGVELMVTSGFRSPEIQNYLYKLWQRIEGGAALLAIAKPGESEHQLGTAVDLSDSSIGFALVDPRFAGSAGGKWLDKNAYKYGFILSYPADKTYATTYQYEPWHWRFIGPEAAEKIHSLQATLNESSLPQETRPLPKNVSSGLALSAGAALSVFVDPKGEEKFLLQKNADERMPAASISKLMTAIVASEIYGPEDTVTVSESAIKGKGKSGYYSDGDTIAFNGALNLLLVGSHNEIARALAEKTGEAAFVGRMNEKARELGLSDTNFTNSNGLDPDNARDNPSSSTARDIYRLLNYIFLEKKDIFSVIGKTEFATLIKHKDGSTKELRVQTTDELLFSGDSALQILGGKTGETPIAGQNLAIVSTAPSGGHIFSVILGSQNRVSDMRQLLMYVKNSFFW